MSCSLNIYAAIGKNYPTPGMRLWLIMSNGFRLRAW